MDLKQRILVNEFVASDCTHHLHILYSHIFIVQLIFTPPKTNMEPKSGGSVQKIFLLKQVTFRFQPLVFGGVCILLYVRVESTV